MKFDLHVAPPLLKTLAVGEDIDVNIGGSLFRAKIIAINGSRVTHEVSDEAVELLKAYFTPEQISFSISGRSKE